MNSTVLLASYGLCCSGLAAGDVAPRLADSPEAQRDRDLTLIAGTTSLASAAELAKIKARVLKALNEVLSSQLAAIDARMREARGDADRLRDLNVERDAALKRHREIVEKLDRLGSGADR